MPYSGCTCPPSAARTTLYSQLQVALHRADLGQAVERTHHEEGVAQPAVAVVPVAAAVRRLGDAGGQRRDDGAGVLVLAQLERDGRADHRVLPLQRQGQPPRPAAPVQQRALLEVARGVVDAAGQRLVGAEQEAHRRAAGTRCRRPRRSAAPRCSAAACSAAAGSAGGGCRGSPAAAWRPSRRAAAATRTRGMCPASGRTRRTSCAGRNMRSWWMKRGAKSQISMPWPCASHSCVRSTAVPAGRPARCAAGSRARSRRPLRPAGRRGCRSSASNTGGLSKRGRQHQTMRAARSTSAPTLQLPITASARSSDAAGDDRMFIVGLRLTRGQFLIHLSQYTGSRSICRQGMPDNAPGGPGPPP
jgi:hypothetical protein